MSFEKNTPESARTSEFSSLDALLPEGQVSPNILLRTLKKDLRTVRDTFSRATKRIKRKEELPDPLLWLTDHFAEIEEESLTLQKSLRFASSLSARGDVPFVCAAAGAVFEKLQEIPKESFFDDLLLYCDEKVPAGFSFEEIDLYPVLLKAAALSRLAERCRAYSDDPDADKKETENKDEKERSLALSVRLFLSLMRYRPYSAADSCRAEALLRRDPSGVYLRLTEQSKAALRRRTFRAAKRARIPDTAMIRGMLEKAEKGKNERERSIGHALPKEKPPRALYFSLLAFLSLGGSFLCAFFSRLYLFPLLFFPLSETAHFLTDTLFSRFFRRDENLPELALSAIPPEGRTLCVITSLLTGEKGDAALFSRLERIYNANSEENIAFGILGDLPDSRSAEDHRDEEILRYAEGRIDALRKKYGDRFFLFIRPRRYSKGERVFMAHERKRGAVIELAEHIKGQKTSLEIFPSVSEFPLRSVKYVITLDADTNLGLGAAKRLVGKMLHPENRPVIDPKKRIVTEGYGILQPRMGTELSRARATPFSRLMCEGGIEPYANACFSVYDSLFSTGNFCGKGIFDVDAFYETICKADIFPDDTILSHDILEGERLRTAQLCDITLTDGFPKNTLSYLKRKHRWIRGDMQNLIYIGRNVTVDGKRRAHFFSALSKYKLLENARRAVTPVFSFFLLAAAFFLKDCRSFLTFCAFLPYMIPFLCDFFRVFSSLAIRSVSRKFFSSGVTVSLWQSFLRMLFCGAMLAKEALSALDAVLRSLYRLCFSRRKLLEWTTAASSDEKRFSLSAVISNYLFSSFIGAFFFLAVPHGLLKAAGLAFFLMPLFAHLFCRDRSAEPKLSEEDSRTLRLYAKDIWKFFEKTVCAAEHFLPPDNLQLFPFEKTAHRTSPTNIGLYLVSLLCARDMGFIDSDTLCRRTENTLGTILRLEKYKGNLYNWYDTTDLSVLSPRYVSSVDSGNFVACLIALKEGLSDYADETPALLELIARLSELIEKTDLSVLFCPRKKLFRVGLCVRDGREYPDESYYDYLMSESRILSYVAAAGRTVPSEHWSALARPLISAQGYIGLASWSGTAFEYFMPTLFMPLQKGSLQYEALVFAGRAQRARRALGAWGISESGYFAFDCDLNYRYKAFGVPILGLKNDLADDLVLSPYSAYLALCVGVKKVLYDLERLTKLGLYGKFGLYEACDFTPGRAKNGCAPVKSYMAHHMGMSLAAISNVLCGSVVRRFMRDGRMACAFELLEEKIPVNAVIRKRRREYLPNIRREKAFSDPPVELPLSQTDMHFACLSDGKACLLASDRGHMRLSLGELSAFESDFSLCERSESLFAYVGTEGGTLGLSSLAGGRDGVSHGFSYCEGSVSYRAEADGAVHTVSFTLSPNARSLLRVRYTNDKDLAFPLGFLFYPLLFSQKRHDAHPAFSGLFVESEFLTEENVLLYKRRPRDEGEEATFLAVAFSDKALSFDFETRGEDLPERISEELFAHDFTDSVGACLSPAALLRLPAVKSAEMFLVLTHSRSEAIEAVENARKYSFSEVQNELSGISASFVLAAGISQTKSDGTVEKLLRAACAPNALRKGKAEKDTVLSRDALWRHGISGDLPICTFDISEPSHFSEAEKLLRAFRLLIMKNVRIDLVLFYEEYDRYNGTVRKKLQKLLSSCGAEGYVGRKSGGVHLLEKRESEGEMPAFRFVSASENPAPAFPYPYTEPIRKGSALPLPKDGFRVRGGIFADGGFYVEKSEAETPFSHVLAGENIGTVVTQNSLGYTFYKNASERRITPYTGNPRRDEDGEVLLYEADGMRYDLLFCAEKIFFAPAKAVYEGKIGAFSYRITVFCSEKLPRKNISVDFSNAAEGALLYFRLRPVMGRFGELCRAERRDANRIFFESPLSESFSNFVGFLFLDSDCIAPQKNDSPFLLCGGKLVSSEGRAVFGLGAFRKGTRAEAFLSFDGEKPPERFARALLPAVRFIPARPLAKSLSLQKMFGTFYAYDAVFSRFLARSGYYQSGGAYGFRDQLQDAILLFYSDRRRALAHIFRAAAHQFPEGDVLHWWHAPDDRGVRTRCSDDLLWLVYACVEYADLFGELSFLDTKIPYLDGKPLSPEKAEEYRAFHKSALCEPLYFHCLRALKRTLSLRGRHGLCKIGSCDWCDGYSLVGSGGEGESVWVSQFAVLLLERFAAIGEKRGDKETADALLDGARSLRTAIEKYGYDEKSGTFIRAYYDDGKPLGLLSESPFRLDILPQAFSSYCNVAPPEKAAKALLAAREILRDKTFSLTKLLSPPFGTENETEKAGYIGGYPPGIRENGGQYTHGALFCALGCFDCAEKLNGTDTKTARELSDFGGAILFDSNPAYRTSDAVSEKVRAAYKTEPYAVAADIYSNPAHEGRGGWTHYTGAAGWLYRLTLRYGFGLRFEKVLDKPRLFLDPSFPFPFPEVLAGSALEVKLFGYDLTVKYIADGKKFRTVDGIITDEPIEPSARTVEVHF